MNSNQLARAVTKVGMILLESGAETYRVEDTMTRICKAYGADVVDAYATPTMLLISFSIHGDLVHNIKRTSIKSVDLQKIDRINALSRRIVVDQIPIDDLLVLLEEYNSQPKYKDFTMIMAAGIATFGFGFFFGGTLIDALCAFLLGILMKIILIFLNKIEFNPFFTNVIGGAFITLGSYVFKCMGVCDSMDIVIISTIMLLVPGLALTNAIRDSVSGDLVSGLARTTEAIFIAIAIALGSGIMFTLIGGL